MDSGNGDKTVAALYQHLRDDAAGHQYFRSSPGTASTWAPDQQHGGPPTALLVRALEKLTSAGPPAHFTRVSTEIIGAIPVGVHRVSAQVLRAGTRISLVQAKLESVRPDGTFRVVARSTAWRMRSLDTTAVATSSGAAVDGGPPVQSEPTRGISDGTQNAVDNWGRTGFLGVTESMLAPGRNGSTPLVWIRPTVDLVAGEPISDLQSIFCVIDIANGVAGRLDTSDWSWMNTDVTVHLVAPPTSPWVGIDADMIRGRHGFGATFADLYDVAGYLGRSAQTLLLDPVTSR